jgi:hypothetical protein
LKHDTNISPSAKKIRGHDGVNFSINLFICSLHFVFHVYIVCELFDRILFKINTSQLFCVVLPCKYERKA